MLISVTRHAETGANRDRVIQGHQPGFLTEYGLKQAKRLGKRLENERLDVIVSSDLKRAVQTAKKVAKRHPDAQFITDRRLREKGAGIYEGCPLGSCDTAALKAGVPTREFRPEGGESWSDVENRVKEFWADLINRFGHLRFQESHPSANAVSFVGRDLPHVLIVTHTGFINALMDYLSHQYSLVDRLVTTGVGSSSSSAAAASNILLPTSIVSTSSSVSDIIPPASFTSPPAPVSSTSTQLLLSSASPSSSLLANTNAPITNPRELLLPGSIKHTGLWTFFWAAPPNQNSLVVLRRNDSAHLKGLLKSSVGGMSTGAGGAGGPRILRHKKKSTAAGSQSPAPAPRSRTPTPAASISSSTTSPMPISTESLPGESAAGSPTLHRSPVAAHQMSPPRVYSPPPFPASSNSPTQPRSPLRHFVSGGGSPGGSAHSPSPQHGLASLRLSADPRNL